MMKPNNFIQITISIFVFNLFTGLILIFIDNASIRIMAGVIQAILLPGYLLLRLLFPGDKDMIPVWRWSLVIPISIAIITLILLIVNYFFVYDYVAVVISITLINILLLLGFFVRIRRRDKDKENGAYLIHAGGIRKQKITFPQVILAIAILFFVGSIVFVYYVPKKTQYLTEFYVLTMDKKIPFSVPVPPDRLINLIVGVTNHEGSDAIYTVVVRIDSQTIQETKAIEIKDSENRELDLRIQLPDSIDANRMELLLNADGRPFPYRQLNVLLLNKSEDQSK